MSRPSLDCGASAKVLKRFALSLRTHQLSWDHPVTSLHWLSLNYRETYSSQMLTPPDCHAGHYVHIK